MKTNIQAALDSIEWKPLPPQDTTELHSTHEGVLEVFGWKFRCYTLSDGQRVFDAGDFEKFLASGGEIPLV